MVVEVRIFVFFLLNKFLSFIVLILIIFCIYNFGFQLGFYGYYRVYEVFIVFYCDWLFFNLECLGCLMEMWKLILLNLNFYLNLLYSNNYSCYVFVDKIVSFDYGENIIIVCFKDDINYIVIEI